MGLKSYILLLVIFAAANSALGGLKITPAEPEGGYVLNNGQNFTLYCSGADNLQWKRQAPLLEEHGGEFNYTISQDNNEDGEYALAINLYNVSEHTVGYYACHTDALRDVNLNNLLEEPKSTDDINYVYIYVNGTSNSFADTKTVLMIVEDAPFVIRCRPTVPDAIVELLDGDSNPVSSERYNPKIGFFLDHSEEGNDVYMCKSRHNVTINVLSYHPEDLAIPSIEVAKVNKYGWNTYKRAVGESISMTCKVKHVNDVSVDLSWEAVEKKNAKIFEDSNGDFIIRTITISDLTKSDGRKYTCKAKYSDSEFKKDSVEIEVIDKPYLNDTRIVGDIKQVVSEDKKKALRWLFRLDGYPGPEFSIWRHNGIQVYPGNNTMKYQVRQDSTSTEFVFQISNYAAEDSGNYIVSITNGEITHNKTVNGEIHAKANATIDLLPNRNQRYQIDMRYTFACKIRGNPLPKTEWKFKPDCDMGISCEEIKINETNRKPTSSCTYISFVETEFRTSGNLTCFASNVYGKKSVNALSSNTIPIIIYEVVDGFKIFGKSWFPRDYPMSLRCIASIYDYVDIQWYKLVDGNRKSIPNGSVFTDKSGSKLSRLSDLKIESPTIEDSGTYVCQATGRNYTQADLFIDVSIEEWKNPMFLVSLENGDVEAKENRDLTLNCSATGVPIPTLRWLYNGEEIINKSHSEENYNEHVVHSMLHLKSLTYNDTGKYECEAKSEGYTPISTFVNLNFKNKAASQRIYLTIICVICLVFMAVVIYLVWKVRKERKQRLEQYNHFMNGDIKKINKNQALDEQADKLPYMKKFEFSIQKLIMSNEELGKGAFGEVYKAKAKGIIPNEKETVVAVKKVKPNADSMYVTALIKELKILVHLGRHINVVNLLGACTKKLFLQQLLVILEYCPYGSLHKYMSTNRAAFVDQLSDSKNHLKNGQYNPGFCSYRDQSIGYSKSDQPSFSGNVPTETTEMSTRTDGSEIPLLTLEPANDSEKDVQWRSNYNYRDGAESLRKYTSSDLISWAFQIASGMNYLNSRKVLHGDLAARNVLLSYDNIAKICDFGLARTIQSSDEYEKKSEDLLPVKWLALECLQKKLFSTKSDVWAYGVVLWELFSLARTPYRSYIKAAELVEMLVKGQRLEKPKYANDKLYKIMLSCWDAEPAMRPSFTVLQAKFYDMLDKNERERYHEQNVIFNELHAEWLMNDNDYISSQILNHDYVNDGVIPSQPELDNDGYVNPSPQIGSSVTHINGAVSSCDQVPNIRAPSFQSEPAAPAERDPMLPKDDNSMYLQVISPSIAEEDEEEDDEIKAVSNPLYNNLQKPAKVPHNYANMIN